MSHLIIFLEIITLAVGSAAILYIYQTYRKYGLKFIKYYFYLVLLSNVFIIKLLIDRYYFENIFPIGQSGDLIFNIANNILNIYLLIGGAYLLARVTFSLREKTLPSIINNIFFGITILMSMLILREIFFQDFKISLQNLYLQSVDSGTFNFVLYSLKGEIIVNLCILFEVLINAGFKDNPGRRRAIILFGSMNLLIAPLTFNPLVQFADNFIIGVPLFFLFYNIIPIIWFRFLFVKYYLGGETAYKNEETIQSVTKKYNITRRESEIITLILKGKSNKEIMDALNLSLNTVRNHIYNLYRKLGIKSRVQLINLLMEQTRTDIPPDIQNENYN